MASQVFNIGGVQGSGGTGLVSDTLIGDTADDTLALGVTNGKGGATGFEVILEDGENGIDGTVKNLGATGAAAGVTVDFKGFENFTFTDQAPGTNGDFVDATAVTSDLTLNTGAGNDDVRFGKGDDTFEATKRAFGMDTVDGGEGDDTLDLSAFTGANRSDFLFTGTNLFESEDMTVTRVGASDKIVFSDFEEIISGGGADVFTSGYAQRILDKVSMGGGDDTFSWLTFRGDELDIDAGKGDDIVSIGGRVGAGHTGLIDGIVEGGEGKDTLALGVTNGAEGATGFKLVLTDKNGASFDGTVEYIGSTDTTTTSFSGFEMFSFTNFAAKTNNDHVDATKVESNLTLNTQAGDDTVNFGSGDDTFEVTKRGFGMDEVNGGEGDDTLDLSALTGANRSDFTFNGTNLRENIDLVVQQNGSSHKITLTDFEDLISGGGNDEFTNGYALRSLDTIAMGAGNDTYSWLNKEGDELDIDGGSGQDTIFLGGTIGAGASGLIDGTVSGGTGTDTLALRFTLGRGDGFEVEFNDEDSGTVSYLNGNGAETEFNGFENFTFSSFNGDNFNDDLVDAREATGNLNIDTAQGDDTILSGKGKDTFTGGQGADTFVFDGAWLAKDKITDFELGVDTFATSGEVLSVSSNGTDTVVKMSNGYVTLENLDATEAQQLEIMENFVW